MKKWITDYPYFWTSTIFLVIMIIGWRVLYWQAENYAFLLLLYFIVTLGIRLDDISRKLGGAGILRAGSGENENLISQLNDIKVSIRTLNATLNKLVEKTENKDK